MLVTHGAFAHFLSEDWDVEDPMTGTAWLNCRSTYSRPVGYPLTSSGEHRVFDFTSDSTSEDAHLEETAESKSSRGFEEREMDPHVLEELRTVSSNESQS